MIMKSGNVHHIYTMKREPYVRNSEIDNRQKSMENNGVCSSSKRERATGRHTPEQVQRLNQFFVICPSPNKTQRIQLSDELGLEPNRIKTWFQNKRKQVKVQNDSSENAVLRASIQRLRCENSIMQETLGTAKCASCAELSLLGGQGCYTELLLQENAQLKQECNRLSNQIIINIANEFTKSLLDLVSGSIPQHRALSPTSVNHNDFTKSLLDLVGGGIPQHRVPGLEYFILSEIAESSIEELSKLLFMDDVFWVKSEMEDQSVLHLENYERIFARPKYFRCNYMCKESSKASGLVPMEGKQLVGILLDSEKRESFFTFLISKSQTIRVPACGDLRTRSGTLQLIYEWMQAISPFIEPREFYILRCCRQIDIGKWVIADISYEYDRNGPHVGPPLHVRHPSGCLIQDLSNGSSEVTWVEHLLVDAKREIREVPDLNIDVVPSGLAFGARRWISTLQTMITRNACIGDAYSNPALKLESEASWLPSTLKRRNMLGMFDRMTTSFCSHLGMYATLDFPQHTVLNNEGIRVVITKNLALGEPAGYVVSAATSVWLPVSPAAAFGFLSDPEKRRKWDSLCRETRAHLIAKIPTGSHQGNSISVMMHLPDTKNIIFQESSANAMGAVIVYEPYCRGLESASYSAERSEFTWLPSGFTITADGHSDLSPSTSSSGGSRSVGCILAALFNFSYLGTDTRPGFASKISREHVKPVSAVLTSTVEKIKCELCHE